jgi:hypothetical protein
MSKQPKTILFWLIKAKGGVLSNLLGMIFVHVDHYSSREGNSKLAMKLRYVLFKFEKHNEILKRDSGLLLMSSLNRCISNLQRAK